MTEIVASIQDSFTSVFGTRKGNHYLREPYSCLSHAAGFILSILALILLIDRSGSDTLELVSSCVFGTCLMILFCASALTHGPYSSARTMRIFDRFDHGSIFFLIAGTYTPVCLLVLRGSLGLGMLALEWILACIGLFAVFFGQVLQNG